MALQSHKKSFESYMPWVNCIGLSCFRYESREWCVSNPSCGWCPTPGRCMELSSGMNCTGNLQVTSCPGLCPTLSHCYPCILLGSGLKQNSQPLSSALWECEWCVQNAICHSKKSKSGHIILQTYFLFFGERFMAYHFLSNIAILTKNKSA